MKVDPIPTNQSSPPLSPPNLGMARYIFALFFVFLLFWMAPFFVVRIPAYAKWTSVPAQEFGFRSAGQNADIVIYGDSAALHGIDPRQMEAALKVRVLNIPSNAGLLAVASDLPLRRYIKVDKPPRVIIFYFAPWDLDYTHYDFSFTASYDGMEMLVRNGSFADFSTFAKAHPLTLAQFPLMFYSLNVPNIFSDRRNLHNQAAQVAATNGHADFPSRSPYPSNCIIPTTLMDRIRFDAVRTLGDTYRSPQTKVLIFVAPIPACLNFQAVVEHSYSMLPAMPPVVMPASLFAQDQFYVHLLPKGVSASTDHLIEAVRPLLFTPKP